MEEIDKQSGAEPVKVGDLAVEPVRVGKLTIALTAIAWFWTAYECDTIGVDVFDMLLFKSQTNGVFVWGLAVVLTYLTVIWMPKHLLTRAIMGLFMLAPGEVFKLTRQFRPDSGFAWVHVVVGFMYLIAVIGMYGMFYPWRIESLLSRIIPTRRERSE